jgi:rod shape-determining protein MreC
MHRIIDFILRFKELVIFTVLVMINLTLISFGNTAQIGGFRTVVIGTVGWLQELFAWIPNPGALQSENRALRELNLQLSSEVTRMRNSLIENKKLRDLMGLKDKLNKPYIPAEIVGKATIELRQYFTLDKGYNDKVEVGMPVRSDAGLVGSIIGTSNNYSQIELITNRNVRIATKIQRTNISGILVWEGGRNFLLKNIPGSFDIQIGDVVLTSNHCNKYPPDVPIGQIIKIEDDPQSLFKRVEVSPFVDFSSIQEVFIMEFQPDPEREKLIQDLEKHLSEERK